MCHDKLHDPPIRLSKILMIPLHWQSIRSYFSVVPTRYTVSDDLSHLRPPPPPCPPSSLDKPCDPLKNPSHPPRSQLITGPLPVSNRMYKRGYLVTTKFSFVPGFSICFNCYSQLQLILSGRCQKFNYGRKGNQKHYHQVV